MHDNTYNNILEISLDQSGKFRLYKAETLPCSYENIYDIKEDFFSVINFENRKIADIINEISFNNDNKYSLVKKDFLPSSEIKTCIYLKIPKRLCKNIPNPEHVNKLANDYHKKWAKDTTIQYRHAFSCFILAFVFLLFRKSYWS
jgi:hypothetical protein